MSPHDEATLSAAERAALASLASRAEADDPRLAAALRGRSLGIKTLRAALPTLVLPSVVVRAAQTWLGPLFVLVGLVVMVVAVSASVVLACAGVLVFFSGGLLSAGVVRSATQWLGRRAQDREGSGGGGGRGRGEGDPTGV